MGVNPQLNLQIWGRKRDNKDEWRQRNPRTLVCSRQAWPPNAQGMNTLSLQDYSVKVTLHYVILIQMSFKFVYINLSNSQLRNNSTSMNLIN